MTISSSFEYFGLIYKKNIAFIYNEDNENFCRFNWIIGKDSDYFIIASILESKAYNKHYHAYEVVDTKTLVIFNIDKMSNSNPLTVNKCLDAKNHTDFIRPQSAIIWILYWCFD